VGDRFAPPPVSTRPAVGRACGRRRPCVGASRGAGPPTTRDTCSVYTLEEARAQLAVLRPRIDKLLRRRADLAELRAHLGAGRRASVEGGMAWGPAGAGRRGGVAARWAGWSSQGRPPGSSWS